MSRDDCRFFSAELLAANGFEQVGQQWASLPDAGGQPGSRLPGRPGGDGAFGASLRRNLLPVRRRGCREEPEPSKATMSRWRPRPSAVGRSLAVVALLVVGSWPPGRRLRPRIRSDHVDHPGAAPQGRRRPERAPLRPARRPSGSPGRGHHRPGAGRLPHQDHEAGRRRRERRPWSSRSTRPAASTPPCARSSRPSSTRPSRSSSTSIPQGARAASAGVYILMGSDVAAMAPQTNLGAATPVALGGDHGRDHEGQGHQRRRRLHHRGLATNHGRNAAWAEQAVRESVSLPAEEALAQNVVEFVAADLPVAAQGHGRLRHPAQGPHPAHRRGARSTRSSMGWIQRFLHAIANPEHRLHPHDPRDARHHLRARHPGLGRRGDRGRHRPAPGLLRAARCCRSASSGSP